MPAYYAVRRETVPMPTPCSRAMVRMLLPAARSARIVWTLAASSATVAGRPSPVPSAFARASPAIDPRLFEVLHYDQKLRDMRKFIWTAIPAIHAIPAVGMSICKTVPAARTDHASSTGNAASRRLCSDTCRQQLKLAKVERQKFCQGAMRPRAIDRSGGARGRFRGAVVSMSSF